MFVDASALVAILTGEPEAAVLMRCLDRASAPITSGLAVFETVTALARKKSWTIAEAEAETNEFLAISGLQMVAIDAPETKVALEAHALYGKGRSHPARLNLGDCFAYACARANGVPLLYVGDDFPQTDIASALG